MHLTPYEPFSANRSRKKPRDARWRAGAAWGPIASRLGGTGPWRKSKGSGQSVPHFYQPVPDVTVFGEMRAGEIVRRRHYQLIYRITPLKFWIKPLAELARSTRRWVDPVWNAGSMEVHKLDSSGWDSCEMVSIPRVSCVVQSEETPCGNVQRIVAKMIWASLLTEFDFVARWIVTSRARMPYSVNRWLGPSSTQRTIYRIMLKTLVSAAGFEPATHALKGRSNRTPLYMFQQFRAHTELKKTPF